MSGYIYEIFGYRVGDESDAARSYAAKRICPFLGTQCTKVLKDRTIAGVCAVHQVKDKTPVICCPNRMYAEEYKMLHQVANIAFPRKLPLCSGRLAVDEAKKGNGAIAVFGHGWGGELRLPNRSGSGSYFVDWILARLNKKGELVDFTAIEVQTIDTTGSYQTALQEAIENRSSVKNNLGLNWENVSKRIIPQLIYKGQVLQREELCRTGLFFVCPSPVFERVMNRLGGREKLPAFPMQSASINFINYDYRKAKMKDGVIRPLGVVDQYSTTVYKLQEAFSSVNLPEGNVYRDAIRKALYD